MNKVTRDINKWFPELSAEQALDVHMALMATDIDFSSATNYELKQAALGVIRTAAPDVYRAYFTKAKEKEKGYLHGAEGLPATSVHPLYTKMFEMGQRHIKDSKNV
jgi:hypothetical protein